VKLYDGRTEIILKRAGQLSGGSTMIRRCLKITTWKSRAIASAGRMRLTKKPAQVKGTPNTTATYGNEADVEGAPPAARPPSQSIVILSAAGGFVKRIVLQSRRIPAASYHTLPQLLQGVARPPPHDSIVPQRMKHRPHQGIDKQRRAHRMQKEIVSRNARPPGYPQIDQEH
jgi:hypothetical protein